MEGGISFANLYGVDEVTTIRESILAVLSKFEDVFEWPEKLPQRREIEHHIHLKKGTDSVNVRLYRYAYQQKERWKNWQMHAILRSNSFEHKPLLKPDLISGEERGQLEIMCRLQSTR